MNDSLDMQQDYQSRIQKVLTYIRTHLSEPMDINQLAAIGNFSAFHFHRIIRAYLNEPLGAYIKRIRLETAAQLLMYSQVPINEISHRIGYEVPSSFTNAFKKRFSLSPQEFRNQQQQTMQNTPPRTEPVNIHFNLSPEIIQLPKKHVLAHRVLGKYESATIAQAWQKLMAYVFQHQLFYPEMEMLGISYDHPEISGEALYHYEACVTLTTPMKSDGEFTAKTLQAGKYATFTYQGSYDQLDLIYNIILKDWLLNSTYELREAPLFDQYLNNPGNAAPEELLTKIFIPIKTATHAI
ncbi:hypothetical protein BKI52_44535 [marine bacterium AO1-C]|nr:hypothetical protein BKI52_44535 [marine bacterium AO1-C]